MLISIALFGGMFVSMTWVLEGGGIKAAGGKIKKAHMQYLWRQVEVGRRVRWNAVDLLYPLRRKGRFFTFWNQSFLLSMIVMDGAVLAVTGISWADGAYAVVILVFALTCCLVNHEPKKLVWVMFGVCALEICSCAWRGPPINAWMAAALILMQIICIMSYNLFRNASYVELQEKLQETMQAAIHMVSGVCAKMAAAFLGNETWEALTEKREQKVHDKKRNAGDS